MQGSAQSREEFARRLREARDLRALSQVELGKKAGLPPSAIGHFEGGRRAPSFENIRALATALEVSADHLMGLDTAVAFRNVDKLNDRDRTTINLLVESMLKNQQGD